MMKDVTFICVESYDKILESAVISDVLRHAHSSECYVFPFRGEVLGRLDMKKYANPKNSYEEALQHEAKIVDYAASRLPSGMQYIAFSKLHVTHKITWMFRLKYSIRVFLNVWKMTKSEKAKEGKARYDKYISKYIARRKPNDN